MRAAAVTSLAALLWLGGGCATTPGASDPAPVVRAFSDCITTYYEVRASGRRAAGPLLARRAEAGGRLVEELSQRGVTVSREEAARGLLGLVPHVERFLHTRTEDWTLAVISPPAEEEAARKAGEEAWPGSVLIGSGVERRAGLEVAAAGRRARYALITYAEEACPPYEVWRARSPSEEPRLFVVDGAIYAHRGRFPAGAPGAAPPEGADFTLEEAVDLAAAGLLFADEADAERRDAKLLTALLDGPRAALALRVLRGSLGSRAAKVALEAFRAAGVEPGAGDAGWAARLARITPDERIAIVERSRAPGGLLDAPRAP